MKKLVLLLMTLLVLSTLVSSPVLAARPSLEYRIHSMFGILYRNFMLYRGVIVVPEGIPPMNNGGNAGGIVGGDADDYGNGRWGAIDETKPINKLLVGCPSGQEEHGSDPVKSVE
ncbi:MAG: hypothetical protein NTW97_00360 [Candidatus Krumholzibacteria bacterium]|nr:hypothetical protein [Candidatus Krumholzibacteria bacterium]